MTRFVLRWLGCSVAAALLAGPLFVAAQTQAKRPLALADYFRIARASAPALSPDGRLVAFVRTQTLEAENREHSEIWIVPADGSEPARRVTSPAFSATRPEFSPDGALVAFSSRRPLPQGAGDAPSDVWFLRLAAPGGEAFQIEGVGGRPLFSPDGRWIAFTRKTPPGTERATAAPDELERRIEERFKGRAFEWLNYRFDRRGYLPDPRDPRASPPEELHVVAREGGTPRQLTRLGVDVRGAAWRPDSSGLVVVADAHQRDEHSYERADLWSVSLGGVTRRLTDDGFDHDSPAVSPDGRLVAVRREQGLDQILRSKQDHGSPVDVFVLPLAGGAPRNLTEGFDLRPGEPTWSGDGRFLFFSAGVGGETHLFRASASGGAVEQVTRGRRRLGDFSFSADRARVAYTSGDAAQPDDVYAARADGADERRLTRVNQELLDEVELLPAERIAYASRDGTRIEGWLILPRPRADGGRHPLILSIHGGPHGAYGEDFSLQRQLWAARGYAVLYTNPRGSTGYGERFLWATWGGWGRLDSEDVLAGVDAALAAHPLDPDRLGVYGYSYGGFLTNWLIGHTPRFTAAISGAGISNWVSDYGTADIPRTKESEFYGPPWEERSKQLLIGLSPVHYAGAVVTPTLFLHGEADLRVPIEQAEQMYVALRKRRVPARFVRYPDSYHGGWTPWNMQHRHLEELRWWQRWLGPAR